MKPLFLILIINLVQPDQLITGQTFTFHSGIRPNNLKGGHFSMKADILKKKRWIYTINYSLVKYIDSYAQPNIKQPNFHIENKRDHTFINFPELDRGKVIQISERDFRPSSLNHRFSLFLGFDLFISKKISSEIYIGPHFGLSRTIQYYIAYNVAEVIVNEGDNIQVLPYHDYQVYRFWDLGLGARTDFGYKIFRNVELGLSGQIYNDVIGGSLDLIIGGGITYNFNEFK